MSAIHPIEQTDDTVTLRRADFEGMLEALDDAEDSLALLAADNREAELGKRIARADHLDAALVVRLLAGEHPIKIWREHRNMTAKALAQKTGVARSYIVEIEGRKKPGSISAYSRVAEALGVTVDDLIPSDPD